MARFYDSIHESDLSRIEGLLKTGGIEYSMKILDIEHPMKEIEVAEEDVQAAEWIICNASTTDN